MSSSPVENKTRKIAVIVTQGRRQNTCDIKVEPYVKLSTLRSHLKARKIKGKLFINGQDYSDKDGNTLLELQTSHVETRSTTTISPPRDYEIHDVQFKGASIDLRCYTDTTAKDLKYFIQDDVGIPACELQLSAISRKGEEKRVSPSQRVLGIKGKLVVKHHPKTFDSVPEDSLTTQGLLYVSKVLVKWTELAEKGLGIGKSDIEAILNDFKNDMKEQRYQALLKWYQTNGNKATWRELIRCCCLIKNDELAKNIIKVYEEGKWQPTPDSPSPVQPAPESQMDVDAMSAKLNNIGKLEMNIGYDTNKSSSPSEDQ